MILIYCSISSSLYAIFYKWHCPCLSFRQITFVHSSFVQVRTFYGYNKDPCLFLHAITFWMKGSQISLQKSSAPINCFEADSLIFPLNTLLIYLKLLRGIIVIISQFFWTSIPIFVVFTITFWLMLSSPFLKSIVYLVIFLVVVVVGLQKQRDKVRTRERDG